MRAAAPAEPVAVGGSCGMQKKRQHARTAPPTACAPGPARRAREQGRPLPLSSCRPPRACWGGEGRGGGARAEVRAKGGRGRAEGKARRGCNRARRCAHAGEVLDAQIAQRGARLVRGDKVISRGVKQREHAHHIILQMK